MDQPALTSFWTLEQYNHIVDSLILADGITCIKVRNEYTLLRSVKGSEFIPMNFNHRNKDCNVITDDAKNKVNGVNLDIPLGNTEITPTSDLPMLLSKKNRKNQKSFLKQFDKELKDSIGAGIKSFKSVRSESLCINIGFDTEFEEANSSSDLDALKNLEDINRRVISLQTSVQLGETLVRYFFLINPEFQNVTKDGGKIPLATVIADILDDLRVFFPELPKIHKTQVVKNKINKNGKLIETVDYNSSEMKAITIPVCFVCHAGKADISVFRRKKYDINLFPRLAEIQGGWCTTEHYYCRVSPDRYRDYFFILDLAIRDTLSLTPAENKSLKALAKGIKRNKVELPSGAIEHMSSFALANPQLYFEYSMNDADLVVGFVSSLFGCNHKIPMTLSSAAASSMKMYMKQYFGVKNQIEFDRMYRGLMMLDEGIVISPENSLKFLKATRYVPINDDTRLFNGYAAEAFTGGFNASFYIGWITDKTTDYDLKNAYPTAMANVFDVDWEKPLCDIEREKEITLQDVSNPLIPLVAYIDFEFPDDVYCPCIPVPVNGLKIYPRKGHNVYACGPDIYLALKLGAKVICHRGFVAQRLKREDGFSRSIAYAVARLVRDRAIAKNMYPNDPLVEKALKAMVNSCYGKTAQNVSPKTCYNAKIMGRVDSEPSPVTSPYHACYITALVRCMLIATINQLHDYGFNIHSVTTDGFITDAPENVLTSLDAYGFAHIFQDGRYILNGNCDNNKENHVWEAKHFNDTILNITTRGNVAVNDAGVLAHNSYSTGEIKDSRADRDAYIMAVLKREGKLKCKTTVWTSFAEIVERRHDFSVREIIRELSMNFDFKRCPVQETTVDKQVHYETTKGDSIDTVIANFDTRPYKDVEEFLNYRKTMKHEDCVKVSADLQRVREKSTIKTDGYLGNDLQWTKLRSIIMGYRCNIYAIPSLDGLKGKERLEKINSWGISKRQFTADDWKNCGRASYKSKMIGFEYVKDTLEKINSISSSMDTKL